MLLTLSWAWITQTVRFVLYPCPTDYDGLTHLIALRLLLWFRIVRSYDRQGIGYAKRKIKPRNFTEGLQFVYSRC